MGITLKAQTMKQLHTQMGFHYANTLCVVGKAAFQVETSPAEWEMFSNMLLMREYFLKKIK